MALQSVKAERLTASCRFDDANLEALGFWLEQRLVDQRDGRYAAFLRTDLPYSALVQLLGAEDHKAELVREA